MCLVNAGLLPPKVPLEYFKEVIFWLSGNIHEQFRLILEPSDVRLLRYQFLNSPNCLPMERSHQGQDQVWYLLPHGFGLVVSIPVPLFRTASLSPRL